VAGSQVDLVLRKLGRTHVERPFLALLRPSGRPLGIDSELLTGCWHDLTACGLTLAVSLVLK
jgi:hypothetical protein